MADLFDQQLNQDLKTRAPLADPVTKLKDGFNKFKLLILETPAA